MATSLELRVPFLDHALVEWAWRLPSNLQVHDCTGKYLLRRAVADLVPAEILNRPKEGFAIPVRDWLRNGLGQQARRLLVDEQGRDSLFNRKEVETLVARHEQEREDLSDAVFTLAVLACWHSIFIERRTVSLTGHC